MKKVISDWLILLFSIACILVGIATTVLDIVKK